MSSGGRRTWPCLAALAFVVTAAGCSSGTPTARTTADASGSPSPSPETSPSRPADTTTPPPQIEMLAYVAEGDLWLIGADGSGKRPLGVPAVLSFSWISATDLDVVTGDGRHLLVGLDWSPRRAWT